MFWQCRESRTPFGGFPARLRARSVEARMDACLAKVSEVNRGDGYQLPYQARLKQPLLGRPFNRDCSISNESHGKCTYKNRVVWMSIADCPRFFIQHLHVLNQHSFPQSTRSRQQSLTRARWLPRSQSQPPPHQSSPSPAPSQSAPFAPPTPPPSPTTPTTKKCGSTA